MNLGLEGARALVGGGSRGLGAAVAAALAAEGAVVATVARSAPSAGGSALAAHAITADLSTEAGVEAAVSGAVGAMGGLDLLLVNSGGPPAGGFSSVDDGAWETAVDGTLLSSIRLIRTALPHLRDSQQASILIVLSSSIRVPIDQLVTSNVMRPGLVGLIKTLALELAPAVRVNGVAPGRIQTERADALDGAQADRLGEKLSAVRSANAAAIPLGRYGRPAEFGAVSAFLLSRAASYVSGQVLPVDGAMTRTYP